MDDNDKEYPSSEELSSTETSVKSPEGDNYEISRRTTLRAIAVGAGVGYSNSSTAIAKPSRDIPTPTDSNTVDYSELSTTARKAFATATESSNPAYFGPSSEYIKKQTFKDSGMNSLRGYSYVNKNGHIYQFDLSRVNLIAAYDLYASQQDPQPNSTVTSIGDISSSRRSAVRQAVETGEFHAAPGRWSSIGEVRDLDFVEVNSETYKITTVFGDRWLTSFTVTLHSGAQSD